MCTQFPGKPQPEMNASARRLVSTTQMLGIEPRSMLTVSAWRTGLSPHKRHFETAIYPHFGGDWDTIGRTQAVE